MVTPISQQRKVQNNIISIRPFKKSDFVMVEAMDERSGNDVAQWVNDLEDGDSNDYSWGVFLEEELIGYCTIGYADDLGDRVRTYPGYSIDSLILSDVYVKPHMTKVTCFP